MKEATELARFVWANREAFGAALADHHEEDAEGEDPARWLDFLLSQYTEALLGECGDSRVGVERALDDLRGRPGGVLDSAVELATMPSAEFRKWLLIVLSQGRPYPAVAMSPEELNALDCDQLQKVLKRLA
ncbi:hypothetical protein FGW37_05470 [Streptomyces rectiverticillatus]|uniref:hypothetical protein n=1 Tax=Streptomyces rectiverticillatus TaxID=173860 RepID=UPI0015C37F77|nr:hypothetical protein [Streptomyces rectiverticillatus]QLE71125.1 hypothetical protein FGW37_05470 [Streptomyces rectiverticillatus]